MEANKSKNTKPGLMLRKALCSVGLNRYRLNYKTVSGRPDIAFVGKKVAIFVNGCFWHRCLYCKPSNPKTNKDYWPWKFIANMESDKRKTKELRKLGWKVFTFWECQIKRDPYKCANKVKDYIQHG